MENKKLPLNENEINIMSILWTQGQPMINSDFIKFNPRLSIHIIRRTLFDRIVEYYTATK